MDTTQGQVLKCYENTSIWQFSHFFFIAIAVSISSTSHFRMQIQSNRYLCTYIVIIYIICFYILLSPNSSDSMVAGFSQYPSLLDWTFNVQPKIPISFRVGQMGLVIAHLFLSLVLEMYVVEVFARYMKGSVNLISVLGDWKRDRAIGVRNSALEHHGLLRNDMV